MKKAERINDMILFLADKNSFNLKELMNRYTISKSTALRDVQSLEEIGLPIYSELGRYGKYQLLDTRIIAPGLFTEGEIYALYFALLTLKSYRSTPFNVGVTTLELKYNQVLPTKLQQELLLMNKIISLEQINHSNTSLFLKDIVKGILRETVFTIRYLKNQEQQSMTVQFIQLSSKFGQWYAKIWNMETKKIRVIRCDKIQELAETDAFEPRLLEELLKKTATFYQKDPLRSFSIEVDEKGKDIFSKGHYPSMTIEPYQKNYLISGQYQANEEDFIMDYLLQFGQSVLQIEPLHLQKRILKRAIAIADYWQKL
ncbi:hypothetical protein A5819_003230 [Enterococcus sp. 7E2_DIV0204]|uniref:helix-turn-helix transcriptional regulator n=1 Tax=unclassified Enterococcus TaxID=2608891 RepID=UPI000A33A337|nr:MULTISPECIES: WYL domain-containing protein [unclassified Enterococcus]OTN86396.1 hypothetical protein A5819_003230 [Enterococcus sp. 7E2_DIV0204]OTP48411.1 hypothetical protein A5884_003074 [Enterococcus sp. 7D2_DIV0200]